MSGIRAQLAVDAPGDCPVADVSADTERFVSSVNRSAVPGEDRVVEEFSVDAAASPDVEEMDSVFSDGADAVYRFSRERDRDCVCQVVEGTTSSPITDVHADDGALFVTFYAADPSEVRSVVADLREEFDGVRLSSLTRSADDSNGRDLALVDRSDLTSRQREVLETAHGMGYFEHPRSATAREVAAALDIAPSTLSEHLSVAQSKLFDAVLDADPADS